MKILFVFGTRPEGIKMAPLIKEAKKLDNVESFVCVTGQHKEMLNQVLDFFTIVPDFDLELMKPDQNLHGVTSDVLLNLIPVIEEVTQTSFLFRGTLQQHLWERSPDIIQKLMWLILKQD